MFFFSCAFCLGTSFFQKNSSNKKRNNNSGAPIINDIFAPLLTHWTGIYDGHKLRRQCRVYCILIQCLHYSLTGNINLKHVTKLFMYKFYTFSYIIIYASGTNTVFVLMCLRLISSEHILIFNFDFFSHTKPSG